MRKPDERCYRCKKPFPTRRVIAFAGGAAVIEMEPDIYLAHTWGIPNRPLAVLVCGDCRHGAEIPMHGKGAAA